MTLGSVVYILLTGFVTIHFICNKLASTPMENPKLHRTHLKSICGPILIAKSTAIFTPQIFTNVSEGCISYIFRIKVIIKSQIEKM
jgi:hypothetical protein